MLIDGEEVGTRETRPDENPATGEVIAHVQEASEADIDRALASARRARPGRVARAPIERAAAIRSIAGPIRRDADKLAQLIHGQRGLPVSFTSVIAVLLLVVGFAAIISMVFAGGLPG